MDDGSPYYQSPIISDLCESLGIDLMDNLLSVDDYTNANSSEDLVTVTSNTYTNVPDLSSCMMTRPTPTSSNVPDHDVLTQLPILPHRPECHSPTGRDDATVSILTPESSPVPLTSLESDSESEKNVFKTEDNADDPKYVYRKYSSEQYTPQVSRSQTVTQSVGQHTTAQNVSYNPFLQAQLQQTQNQQMYHVQEPPGNPYMRQNKRARLQQGVNPDPMRYANDFGGTMYCQNQHMTQNMYYQMCWRRYRQLALLAHAKGLHKVSPQSHQHPDIQQQSVTKQQYHPSRISGVDKRNLASRAVAPPSCGMMMNANNQHESRLDTSTNGDILDRQCQKIPSPINTPPNEIETHGKNIKPAIIVNEGVNRQCVKIQSPTGVFNRNYSGILSPALTPTGCNTPDSGYSTPVHTPNQIQEPLHRDNPIPGSYILTSTPMHTGLKRRHSFSDDSGFMTDEHVSPTNTGMSARHPKIIAKNARQSQSTITLNTLNTMNIPITPTIEQRLSVPSQPVQTSGSKRGRNNIPLNHNAVKLMSDWYDAHADNPYPDKKEKDRLSREGGITLTQVKSWFANKRTRSNNTRPKIQQMKMKEKLMDICKQLTVDQPSGKDNNSVIIQQLSHIVHQSQSMR